MDQKTKTIQQRRLALLNLCPGTKNQEDRSLQSSSGSSSGSRGVAAPSGAALNLQSVPLFLLGQLDPVDTAVLGCFCIAAERKMDLLGTETHRPGPDSSGSRDVDCLK